MQPVSSIPRYTVVLPPSGDLSHSALAINPVKAESPRAGTRAGPEAQQVAAAAPAVTEPSVSPDSSMAPEPSAAYAAPAPPAALAGVPPVPRAPSAAPPLRRIKAAALSAAALTASGGLLYATVKQVSAKDYSESADGSVTYAPASQPYVEGMVSTISAIGSFVLAGVGIVAGTVAAGVAPSGSRALPRVAPDQTAMPAWPTMPVAPAAPAALVELLMADLTGVTRAPAPAPAQADTPPV